MSIFNGLEISYWTTISVESTAIRDITNARKLFSEIVKIEINRYFCIEKDIPSERLIISPFSSRRRGVTGNVLSLAGNRQLCVYPFSSKQLFGY
ncbi:hypothetical protein AVEN_14626-1 [Araneus ventricosus]|uniref:Uncharacterized protein n=1 Tax=Araneus ventricosus TaxID=182803 RepID=A0A4Y2N8D9_ARAVE|nr:hypothetical protein AVEN_14626-1 [Araneus ventricosus]